MGGIGMKIDEWIIREVIDTLHQANITLLRITGLDSPQEIAKKRVENETAINRRISNAIGLLESSIRDGLSEPVNEENLFTAKNDY